MDGVLLYLEYDNHGLFICVLGTLIVGIGYLFSSQDD